MLFCEIIVTIISSGNDKTVLHVFFNR